MTLHKNLLEKPSVVTGVSAFISGMFTHAFALTNILHNYDNITAFYNGFGAGVGSGRWALTFISAVMHKFFGGYNLPWFNGIITIVLLSLAAASITETFQLRRRVGAVLLGILFLVFPTVSSTLFFRFVSLYDALAILLAVFAAYALSTLKSGFIICAVCTAVSMGIYQAYFPMTVTIMVLLLLQMALRGTPVSAIIKKGVYFLLCLVLALFAYLIAQKTTQTILNASLTDYQGIAQMGKLQLTELPILIVNAVRTFLTFSFTNYCSLTPNFLAAAIIPVLYFFTLISIVYILALRKYPLLHWALVGVILLILPISIGLIEVMAPQSKVYTLMAYSYVFVFITPLIILDELLHIYPDFCSNCIGKHISASVGAILILLSLTSLNYVYLDNVNYTSLYYTTVQTENYLNALIVQVRMTEGYRASQKWAFVGDSFQDPLLNSLWADSPRYGGNDAYYINAYSRMRWLQAYFGYSIPLADEDTIHTLSQMEEVVNMPCFPDQGSIQVINDVVVIKLQNQREP